MKRAFLSVALLSPGLAQAQGGALSGPTGLLTVPTAEVVEQGAVRSGMSWHDPTPRTDSVVNYLFTVGFLPGLEVGGRVADEGCDAGAKPGICDLSFLAKYRWRHESGLSIAVGGQDIGGAAQNFRSHYAVATLPWHTLKFTAGYDWGPDVLDGAIGGIEWQPWPFLGIYAEYDAEEVNPGLRLQSAPLWAGLRLGANVGHRGATDEVEGGVELTIPLGRRGTAGVIPRREAPRDPLKGSLAPLGMTPPPDVTPSPSPLDESADLRAALEALGFESVRTGTRGESVLVVSLENRRYNHSQADGIGLALGTIAMRAPPEAERIELVLLAYGVPQVVVATSPPAYREFLRDGTAGPDLLEVRYSNGAGSDVRWHNPASFLRANELVIEPVLRTFVATEYGVADAGLGARARFTAPLAPGVMVHLGMQVPVLLSNDFQDGENFEGVGPEAGLDLLLFQFAHKTAPWWTTQWSFGLTQVYQTDLRVLGVEQLFTSPEGRHKLNVKLMALDSAESHRVALAGYTWFDASRRFSAGLTGGRFYADDKGVRLDLNRYFDDTIVGLFLKVEAEDNMAGGFQMSLPLTPRRDAAPEGIQVKGARRWGHSLQTTLNQPGGRNVLKPLLLYEPFVELDLRRDFLDSNRLGPDWLRGQLPRLREAYLLWGSP